MDQDRKVTTMGQILKDKLNELGDIKTTARYFGVSSRTLARWMAIHGIQQYSQFVSKNEPIQMRGDEQ
jgi:AraC-like DNA-binding protein